VDNAGVLAVESVTINDSADAKIAFTNTYKPELTELEVKKVWLDTDDQAHRPASITVSLMHSVNNEPATAYQNKTVTLSFSMDTDDASYASRTITVVAEGAVDAAGNSTFVVDRTASNVTVSGRTVTISGLLTTTGMDDVSFTIDADEYAYGTAVAQRQLNEFNGSFEPSSLGITAGEVTTYSFSIPSYTDDMLVNVTLVGLKPADDETQLVPVTGVEGAYTFDPRTSGNKSLRLQTINAAEGTCSITLEAEDYYYRTETDTLEQVGVVIYSGTNKTVTISNVSRPSVSGTGTRTYSAEINSITVDGAAVEFNGSAKYDYNNYTGTVTINLSSIVISGMDISETTEVKFNVTVTQTRGGNSKSKIVEEIRTIEQLGLEKQ
jgi:hypothetical protein